MLDPIQTILGDLLLWAGLLVLAALYFLPTAVVLMRHADAMVGVVIVLNVFLGWTFLGWVVSLALAMVGSSTPRRVPYPTYPAPQAGQPYHSWSASSQPAAADREAR
jgi:hypothetical protein